MKMMKTALAVLMLNAGISSAAVMADDHAAKAIAPAEVSVTKHQGTFNGQKMNYTATAGETLLKNREGKVIARVYSTAYVKDGVKDSSKRPVSFIYNGGPGSSSVWLHMGAFGPKVVEIPSDAEDDGAAPYKIKDNAASFLDVSDIVFIDPVGTGFSKVEGVGKGTDFWGVHEDAQSIANFIRVWLRENGRWNSPKYIGGESYGTTRSAALIRALAGRFDDVSINGILLISTILDFTVDSGADGNEMVYMAYLPTMAATAQYHGKAGQGKTVEEFTEEARQFALNDYAPALLKGYGLKGEERAAILDKLASFTGLSKKYLEQNDLRVPYQRFLRELMREEGFSVGRLDGRFKGRDRDNGGDTPDTDPSFYGIDGSYTTALNTWVRQDLKFNPDREYSIIGGLGGPWNWKIDRSRNAYLNVAPYIGKAMRENKELRVFNAAGYYDFATPLFGAEYSLNRNGIDPSRVTYTYYPAGHMMYIHHPSLKQLNDDIRDFIVAGNR